MRNLVLLVNILCLFAVAQSQIENTTSSFRLLLAKGWYAKTGGWNISDLSDLSDKIFFIDNDSIVKEANDEHKEIANKHNHTNNSEGNKTNTTILDKSHGQPEEISNVPHCTEKNERYPVPGICDSYIECQNGKAEEKQCPDGLRYNHNVKPDKYPCQYPTEVQCTPGSKLQPPKPNDVCPNQFGYFKTEDRYNCSSYRICENGIGYDYQCPKGLAFSIRTSRCEWPDRVPECNVRAFLGFKCPDVPNLSNSDIVKSYRSPNNCTVYYSCYNGKPRRLECDEYFAFNEITQTCVPANEVAQCTMLQRTTAEQLVKRLKNGDYQIKLLDEEYQEYRNRPLKFRPKVKSRPKTIP